MDSCKNETSFEYMKEDIRRIINRAMTYTDNNFETVYNDLEMACEIVYSEYMEKIYK